MKLKINGKEYTLKYTLRAVMIYENITGHMLTLDTLTDQLSFMYAVIMANNPESDLQFEGLIDAMDNDPSILVEFTKFLTSEFRQNEILNPDSEQQEGEDKKKE